MAKPIEIKRPCMVDIRFLQPVIDGYKFGIFDNKGLPVRVINALDSLSYHGNTKSVEYRIPLPTPKTRKKRNNHDK